MFAAIFLTWWFLDGGRRLERQEQGPEAEGTLLGAIGMLFPWIAVLLFLLLP